jgi:signal transduction histidine kinase
VVTRLRALFSKREFVNETVDLVDAANEVIALSSHELQRHRVSIHTEFESDTLEVSGDRVQLQQVVLNLLLNACDALKGVENRSRAIFVKINRDDANAKLSLRDTGIGIANEGLSRLFHHFYTTKSDGMGIGLSVSRSIIERHQGSLWAANNDGPGATFTFSIPIIAADETTASPRSNS